MGTQSQGQGGQSNPMAPGKPSSRQPPESNTGEQKAPDEGQKLPKTGRDSSEPIEQDIVDDDSPDNDVEDDDADEDELGNIELPGENDGSKGLDGSRPAGNP